MKHAIARYLSNHHPKLWLNYNIQRRSKHFETEYWLIPIFCSNAKISIDVGVNMGVFSYYMAKYSRQVIGFEPNIDLWPYLRRILNGNVRLENAALSDRSGTGEFRYVEDNSGVATIEAQNRLSMVERPETIKSKPVALRTLDSFALADVSFIKIDVEGHEEAVLHGAQATLADSRPAILVESEDRHNPGAPQRLARWFSAIGYEGFYVKHRQLCRIETLTSADMQPRNLEIAGGVYINNFIYLSGSEPALIERTRAAVARL